MLFPTQEDFHSEVKKYLEDIIKDATNVINIIDNLTQKKLAEYTQEEINTIISDAVIDSVYEVAPKIIVNLAEKAILSTEEYNHPLFYDRFIKSITSAVYNNLNEILIASPHGYTCDFTLRLENVLGDIELYANAVKKTREALNLGKTPPNIRSHIWSEKIYGVSREGKRVYTRRKNRKTGEIKVVDVTERYIGKYEKTILTRLSFLPPNTAPYWYFINYGNAISMSSDIGGAAYPIVNPTYFVESIQILLTSIYEEEFKRAREYLEKKEENRFTTNIGEVEVNITKYGRDIIVDIGGSIYTGRTSVRVEKYPAGAYMEEVYITRTGKVVNRYRDIKTGRFISI